METKKFTLQWLIMLILLVSSVVVKAQPYPESGAQTVCISGIAEPYGVINTVGSSYLWTVDGATTSLNWVLTSTGTNLATVLWITPGNYTVQILETNAAGCSNPLPVELAVTVNPLPTAIIAGTIAVCEDGTSPDVTFTGANGTAPYTFTYTINGGSNLTVTSVGNSVTVAAPTTVPGTFTYALVSVQDASTTTCSQAQTGSAVITVNPLPTAIIAGTIAVCEDGTSPDVTFTGANGTAPYTFTYTINGGSNLTVTSVGNSVTVAAPTTVPGTFTYALVSVQDASTTTCSQAQTGSAVITVNPLPTAIIAGTIAVCEDGTSPDVTFTGANGTAPYTFTYTINGGSNLTVTSVGNSVTVAAPTTLPGTFTYALVSVQDASTTTCSQAQAGSAVITVNPLPTAIIAGTIAVCEDGTSPDVTFTGANGTAPYTFTYTINGGSNLTVTSVGNSVTVAAPTTIPGTFTYALVSVQDASTTTCSQAQTGSAVITVNPLPTAIIAGTTNECRNGPSPEVTFTGANGTAPYTFTYTINGGSNLTVTTSVGNSVTVAAPTTVSGVFTYELVSVQDASGTTCSQAQIGSAVITIDALPTTSTIYHN